MKCSQHKNCGVTCPSATEFFAWWNIGYRFIAKLKGAHGKIYFRVVRCCQTVWCTRVWLRVIGKLWARTFHIDIGRRQNSLPLSTNLSQKLTQPSTGISYPVSDLCRHYTKLTLPSAYTLHIVQMAFYDLSHTFHKQVTNVSQHVFVILLWGILTSPLKLQ